MQNSHEIHGVGVLFYQNFSFNQLLLTQGTHSKSQPPSKRRNQYIYGQTSIFSGRCNVKASYCLNLGTKERNVLIFIGC